MTTELRDALTQKLRDAIAMIDDESIKVDDMVIGQYLEEVENAIEDVTERFVNWAV